MFMTKQRIFDIDRQNLLALSNPIILKGELGLNVFIAISVFIYINWQSPPPPGKS